MSVERFSDQPGLPPIRTGTYFWGRLGITRKQSGQVEVESRLFIFLLSFLTEMATMGLCGFLEDPAFPVWLCDKDAPSGLATRW